MARFGLDSQCWCYVVCKGLLLSTTPSNDHNKGSKEASKSSRIEEDVEGFKAPKLFHVRRRVAIFKSTPNQENYGSNSFTADPAGSVWRKPWSSIGLNDTQADMLPGVPESAICVQRFDDSLNSAIHITYRSWLRSSSMHEPRDPPLKVVIKLLCLTENTRCFSI